MITQVVRDESQQLQFVGHAWKNTYTDKKTGVQKESISISLDLGIKEVVWKAGDRLTLFENKQREFKKDGTKANDAPYRVVVSPALQR